MKFIRIHILGKKFLDILVFNKILSKRTVYYTKEGKHKARFIGSDIEFHRINGPAIIKPNGTKEWWVDGKRHRLDGPAIEWPNSYKSWYVHGILHRLDGPAIIFPDGTGYWYVDGDNDKGNQLVAWAEENNIDLTTAEGKMAAKLKWE